MMNITDVTLRKLQKIQMLNLLEVKRICDKYDIHYFLAEGSLLGAVRHHGFIPWDDDIDVGMLRDDYTKFIDVCNSELSTKFFLQTKESDEYCSIPWAKLQLKNTIRRDASTVNNHTHNGIDIDIFPYDNIPSCSLLQNIHSNICWFLRGVYGVKCNSVVLNMEKSLKKKYGILLCRIFALFISKALASKLIDLHFQRFNGKSYKYVMNLSSAYNYKRERISKEIISDLTELSFEGIMFPVPRKYHECLENIYGDYMKLPADKDRIQHAIVELDFGEY